MQLDVLYLDDEPELCEIFALEFASVDISVVTFTSVEKTLEAVKNFAPDLAFIDYRLPSTNGDRVAQLMPASISKYLITGENTVSTQYKFIGVFDKPYDMAAIRAVLNDHLTRKRAAVLLHREV